MLITQMDEQSGGYADNFLINTDDYKTALSEIQFKVVNPLINFNDIPVELEYRSGGKMTKPSLHVGQRKLFLSELQFLTNHLKNHKDVAYVVYAGAAPSNSKYELMALFPNVKFILVDPAEIKIFVEPNLPHYKFPKNHTVHKEICYIHSGYYDANKNVESFLTYNGTASWNTPKLAKFIKESDFRFYIIEDFYDNDASKNLASLSNDAPIFFWSDIRSNVANDNPKDLDIIWNLCMQYTWSVLLKANYSMYKYRVPYMSDKSHFLDNYKNEQYMRMFNYAKNELPKNKQIDFVGNYNKGKLLYPSGDIIIQAFAPVASTESRLTVNMKKCTIIDYDMKTYDNHYYYYNNVFRLFQSTRNPISNKHTGFDHCNDCGLEYQIWYNYYNKYHNSVSNNVISHQVEKLTEITNRSLKHNGHGHLFPANFDPLKNKNNQLLEYYNRILKFWDSKQYDRKKMHKHGPGEIGYKNRNPIKQKSRKKVRVRKSRKLIRQQSGV